MRLQIIAVSLLLSGCFWSKKVELPEKATTNSLTRAESELDAANDARLSKIAASARVASRTLTDASSPPLKIVKSELEVTQLLAGEPTPADLKEAEARVEAELDGKDGTYADALVQVAKLNKSIKLADKNYEAEKAKKQAEYNAKLAERELQNKALADSLAAERQSRIEDRFIYGGTIAFAIGFVALVSAPSLIIKRAGSALAVVGAILFSIPFISHEPWFKTAIGWTIGIVLMGIGVFIASGFAKKRNEQKNDSTSVPPII